VLSRRGFVGGAACFATLGYVGRPAFANPLGLPLGLQLYSVRQQMAGDFTGALAAVANAGYTEVEAASLPNKSAKEVRKAFDQAGLRCVSAHHGFSELLVRFDETVTYDKELGVQYIICATPGRRTPPAPAGSDKPLALDDWRYCAEQLNAMGERAAHSGVRFGYHNHSEEFAATDGKIPLIELLRLTDPERLTFELDCGWVVVGGSKPVEILRDFPHRFSMLHVKDFTFSKNQSTGKLDAKAAELGQGVIDYGPTFAQASKTQKILHVFVEQEEFDMPWIDALKLNATYMRAFK
jgi:sugar phosphate isomerase/epimerase